MLKNVLIDPYMFELSEEEEIENNIRFFQEIIRLCKSNRILVFLYKELYDRIRSGEVRPFPVDISGLRDSKLKKQILVVNANFRHALANWMWPVDVDDCFGKAVFTSGQAEIDADPVYYELMSILMKSCYTPDFLFENKILTGVKRCGLPIGTELAFKCTCEIKEFQSLYVFSSIDEFISTKDRAFYCLQDAAINKKFSFKEEPEVVKGEHHNHIQSNDFDRFSELTRKNRRVLNPLRYFGLNKIIFERFRNEPGKTVGSVVVNQVEKTNTQDIFHAYFYAETGFKYNVSLYFPVDIGAELFTYLDGDFSYKNVENLKSMLALTK